MISYYFILFMSAQRYKSIYQFLKFSKHIWTLSYLFDFFSVPRETKKQRYPLKFRSVLLPRKNAQNVPATPETIITPITKILVESKMELANTVFLQEKPTSTLAKFHKDKYLQTSSIYLPVYLLSLLKIRILPRIRLLTFSVFIYSFHRKPIISIQLFPTTF